MATAKKTKVALEVLFARAELKGVPERALLKSRNMVQVDMIWPRPGVAKKSAMREAVFRKGVCDFAGEPWTKRVVFREEVEGRCGFAVSVTEPVSVQKLRRFLRLSRGALLARHFAAWLDKLGVSVATSAASCLCLATSSSAARTSNGEADAAFRSHKPSLSGFPQQRGGMATHCRKRPRTRKKPLNISKSRRAAGQSEAVCRDFWNIWRASHHTCPLTAENDTMKK